MNSYPVPIKDCISKPPSKVSSSSHKSHIPLIHQMAIIGYIRNIDKDMNIPHDIKRICMLYYYTAVNEYFRGNLDVIKITDQQKSVCSERINMNFIFFIDINIFKCWFNIYFLYTINSLNIISLISFCYNKS